MTLWDDLSLLETGLEKIELEWSAAEGARAYRLSVHDANSGEELARSGTLSEPRYGVDASLAEARELEVRLELQREASDGEAPWEPAGPPARIQALAPGTATTRLRWPAVSPLHRLVIADQTAASTLSDQVVLGSSWEFPWSAADQGHDLVMRVHGWKDGDWDQGTEWRPLPLEVALRERCEPQASLERGTPPALMLVFSIDTEAWLVRQRDPDPRRVVDEMVFGDFGGFEHRGIGLHMDLLEHFGFKGCFFVDVLMEHQYGRPALERTIEAILSRGHEVQLHLHDQHLAASADPSVRSLAGDLLAKDADEFRRILELAVDLFERRTGKPPIAYRAGGYRITDAHFPALEEVGIAIDSSVNAYWNSRVSDWMRTRTQPFWVGDVLELPVTWTLVRDHRDAPETRAFAPNATSGDPVSSMPGSRSQVPRVASFVSHSFELMRASRDASPEAIAAYERQLRAKADPELADRTMTELAGELRVYDGEADAELLARVAGMLRRIADRPDARCVTFTELNELANAFPSSRDQPVDPVPALDRPRGVATVTGARIYTEGLLAHLSSSKGPAAGTMATEPDEAISSLIAAGLSWEGRKVAVIGEGAPPVAEWLARSGARGGEGFRNPDAARAGEFDFVIWHQGFERADPANLGKRLAAAATMLGPDGLLFLHVRTLGVGPAAEANGGPPLAELLFAAEVLRSADGAGAGAAAEVTPWDASTFANWLSGQGFELVAERRLPRAGVERAALERYPDKLGALSEKELGTGAVDFTLRPVPGRPAAPQPEADAEPGWERAGARLAERLGAISPGDSVLELAAEPSVAAPEEGNVTAAEPGSLLDSSLKGQAYDVVVCAGGLERIELERLGTACAALYGVLRPGGRLLLSIAPSGSTASVTTLLVVLLRAGFELIRPAANQPALDYELVRPLDFADIANFSGL